jgi:hypothetical protein
VPKPAHPLNRPAIIWIPAFFADDARCRHALGDIEPAGLWFRGDAPNDRFGKHEDAAPPDDTLATVFLFNQIVYVFDPARFA